MERVFKDVLFMSVGSIGGEMLGNYLKDKVEFFSDKGWLADAVIAAGGIFLAAKYERFAKLGYGLAVVGMANLVSELLKNVTGENK